MVLRVHEEHLREVTVMHVAGRLEGEVVDELGAACRAAGGSIRLDLTGLLHADEVGLGLLRSLRASGAELTGVSPFVEILLDGPLPDAPR